MRKNSLVAITALSLSFGMLSCNQNSVTKYTVTFDANGGTVEQSSITVNAGTTTTLPTPTKESKNFLGWFTGWNSEDVKYTNSTKIEKDITLYAKWDTYDISFLNYDESAFKVEQVDAGSTVTAPSEIPGRASDDNYCYFFDKWDFNFETKINSDTSIHPLWNKEVISHSTINYHGYFTDKTYELRFIIRSKLFDVPSNIFDRSIASFSLGLNTCNPVSVNGYLRWIGFDDIVQSNGFTDAGDGYTFAHNKFNGKDVVVVVNKGVNYGNGWASNFDVGLEGPHAGFYSQALTVYQNLQNYLQTYQETPYKLLITGYSRAGAISDLLARELLINNKIGSENLYTYTFEAPKSIPSALLSGQDYSNIFNVINSADIVPLVMPTQFDNAVRPGKDINIYRDDIDNLLKEFDSEISIGTFTPTSEYQTEAEYANYIVNSIANYQSTTIPTMNNREEYVNNYQEMFKYMISLFMGLKSETLTAIENDIAEKGLAIIMTILYVEDGLFSYLNPFIRNDGIEYNENELKANCSKVVMFLNGPGSILLSNYTFLQRTLAMHTIDINYVLLREY